MSCRVVHLDLFLVEFDANSVELKAAQEHSERISYTPDGALSAGVRRGGGACLISMFATQRSKIHGSS